MPSQSINLSSPRLLNGACNQNFYVERWFMILSVNYFFSGDTHGDFSRFRDNPIAQDKNNYIVIAGDCGANFFGGKRDARVWQEVSKYPCRFYTYCGNHDMRPQNAYNMERIYDEAVKGWVWWNPYFPNLRYFEDYGIYMLGKYKCAIIGHAYSVDKYYRLMRNWTWHPDEQLTAQERHECQKLMEGQHFDFVMTHTAPYNSRPIDKFLACVDQSTVDETMEHWLEALRADIDYDVWLLGHYHIDRIQEPKIRIFYQDIDSLDNIYAQMAEIKI